MNQRRKVGQKNHVWQLLKEAAKLITKCCSTTSRNLYLLVYILNCLILTLICFFIFILIR